MHFGQIFPRERLSGVGKKGKLKTSEDQCRLVEGWEEGKGKGCGGYMRKERENSGSEGCREQ